MEKVSCLSIDQRSHVHTSVVRTSPCYNISCHSYARYMPSSNAPTVNSFSLPIYFVILPSLIYLLYHDTVHKYVTLSHGRAHHTGKVPRLSSAQPSHLPLQAPQTSREQGLKLFSLFLTHRKLYFWRRGAHCPGCLEHMAPPLNQANSALFSSPTTSPAYKSLILSHIEARVPSTMEIAPKDDYSNMNMDTDNHPRSAFDLRPTMEPALPTISDSPKSHTWKPRTSYGTQINGNRHANIDSLFTNGHEASMNNGFTAHMNGESLTHTNGHAAQEEEDPYAWLLSPEKVFLQK